MIKGKTRNRASIVKFVIFMAYLAYLSIGFFPSAPIENDGNGIANGAAIMAVHGFGANDFSYRYEIQTGSYVLIVWLHNATGLTTIDSFSLLSSISCIVFIIASAALISRLTGFSLSTSGIVLLLFQEVFTGGYYPNTTVIAAAFLMLALYCAAITSQTYLLIASGILLGISAWMRFDSIFVAPVLILLLHRSSWKNTLRELVLVLTIATIVSTLAIYLSGSGYYEIIESAKAHLDKTYLGTQNLGIPLIGNVDFKSHISIFSVLSIAMLATGLATLISTHKWRLIGIGLLGIIPFYIVYFGKITTPKYIYYLLPFFSIFTVSALIILKQISSRKWKIYIVGIATILFTTQYILGIQASFTTKPYINAPFPTLVKLLTLNGPISAIKNISFVIGAGTLINTDDGDRLPSGILFAPVTWNEAKSKRLSSLIDIDRYTTEFPNQTIHILADTYGAKQLALNFLISRNYTCLFQKDANVQIEEVFKCNKNSQIVTLVIMPEITERRIESIQSHIDMLDVPRLLFIAPLPWEQYLLEQYMSSTNSWIAKKVGDFSYDLEKQP